MLFLGWKKSFFGSYSFGIVVLLSVFQFAAYPLYRAASSFTALFVLYTVLLFALIAISLIILSKKHIRIKDQICMLRLPNQIFNSKGTILLFLILLFSILFFYFMSLGFYYSSSDDGYNIPRAMEVIAQNSLGVNDTMAWYGRDNAPITNFENASTWYFFIAYLSYISGIQATILSKTVFLIILLSVHLSSVIYACECIDANCTPQKKVIFLILYIVFQMMSVKPSSAGTWMTGYLYEGKATMLAVVFPLLMASCANIITSIDKNNFKDWLSIFLVLAAGIELSVVGIFLPGILYFCYGIAFLISTKFRHFKKIIIPVIFSILPVVIFGILSYISADTSFFSLGGLSGSSTASGAGGLTAASGKQLNDLLTAWKSSFLEGIDFWQFVLFILSAVYFIFAGNQSEKTLLTIAPFVLFLTFLNPILADFVSEKITTPIVYWRLWWLLPVYFAPALAFSDFLDRVSEGKPQNTFLSIAISLPLLAGFEIFRYSIVSPEYTVIPFAENVGKLINVRPELRPNAYNLNAGPLKTAEAILSDWDGLERPKVFMCFNRPFELRQYSTEITIVGGVRNYDKISGIIPGTDTPISEFAQSYNEITDGNYLKDMVKRLGIDYICFDGSPAVAQLEQFGFKHISDAGGIDLWKITEGAEQE